MTKEEKEMITRALEAHRDRIGDVQKTTTEAISIARKNQVLIARIEEKLIPLERGIGEIRDSVRSLTDALEAGDARLILKEHEHRLEAVRAEFHECRKASSRRLRWFLGILAALIVGAIGYLGDVLFKAFFTGP